MAETIAVMFMAAPSAAGTAALAGAATTTAAAGVTFGAGGAAASLAAAQATSTFAAGGLLAGAFSGVSTGDMIFGGLQGFSALSDIAAGNAAADALNASAAFEDLAAQQEVIKGRQEALQITEAMTEALEQNIVNAGASGITGEGSVKAAQLAIKAKGEQELDTSKANSEIAAASRRVKGRSLRLDADARQTGGFASAVKGVAQIAFLRTRRG